MILLLIFSLLCSTAGTIETKKYPDYYVLALYRCDYDEPWLIHGLWPQWNATSWPTYCNRSDPLNVTNIESLMPQLHKHWYSCDGNSTKFWEHEWLKHGTCSVFDQYYYFASTIQDYKIMPRQLFCFSNKLNCQIPLSMEHYENGLQKNVG